MSCDGSCWYLVRRSENKATGLMPVVIGTRETCPPGCPLRRSVRLPDGGKIPCYAEYGRQKLFVDVLEGKAKGPPNWVNLKAVTLTDLVIQIVALRHVKYRPARSLNKRLARFGGRGDLPHRQGRLVQGWVSLLARAMEESEHRWMLFTHHGLSPHNIVRLRTLQGRGVTVNVSCETMAKADKAIRLGFRAALIRQEGWGVRETTPDGNLIVHCRKQATKGTTCRDCAECWDARSKVIWSFDPHGEGADAVREVCRIV